ncbi:unnamed protein product [Didymodactylos carnosus]|uniref:Uncharacterized protein n=1 Tax=Didymodactylos carnosus TaxID=1234261 RepID=A0A814FDV2_9BILA|nr:unnamed protein product [Didymodactylos carnosus]CAF3752941.1 unnamed protein product [Didymodactylos carnosus]
MSAAVMKQSSSSVLNSNKKSSFNSNQMTESWIVIDEQIESDYVLIDNEQQHEHEHFDLITQQESHTGEEIKEQQEKQIIELQQKIQDSQDVVVKEKRKISPTNILQQTSTATINGAGNSKKRKWKLLAQFSSQGIKNAAHHLDNYIVDSNQQLFDKRDLLKKLCGA